MPVEVSTLLDRALRSYFVTVRRGMRLITKYRKTVAKHVVKQFIFLFTFYYNFQSVWRTKKCRFSYKFKSLIVIKGKRVKRMRGLFLKYKFSKGTKILCFFFNTRAAIILRKKKGNADARKKKKGRKEDTERQRVKRWSVIIPLIVMIRVRYPCYYVGRCLEAWMKRRATTTRVVRSFFSAVLRPWIMSRMSRKRMARIFHTDILPT